MLCLRALPRGAALPEPVTPSGVQELLVAASPRCPASRRHGVRVPSGPSTSLASAGLRSRPEKLHKTNRL